MNPAAGAGGRSILHVDMDAFFAAIEVLDRPELKGKPVVIGAPPDQRGVVSTASYEARRYGIHSAMPSRTAGKLCPHAVFLPVRMARYLDVSERLMELLDGFTPMVEQLSVDEAFLDVRGALRTWGTPLRLARALKARIRDELALTASVGVAPNKFLAKLASDLEKPDGLTVVPAAPDEVAAFLAPLPVTRIWGVGRKTAEQLHARGVATMGDLQRWPAARLREAVGDAAAQHIRALAFGRDEREVVTEREAKSISAEHTFAEDCGDPDVVRQVLLELTEQVGRRLRRAGKYAGVGQLKLRDDRFDTRTRRRTLRPAVRADRELVQCALMLLEQQRFPRPVRLVGFGVSALQMEAEHTTQPLLLDDEEAVAARRRNARLDQAVDALRETYGPGALRRGQWSDKSSRPPKPE